jgi:anti-sigma factor RsiW
LTYFHFFLLVHINFLGEVFMNCPDFEKLIAERVADELTAEQRAEMDAHEQSCSGCRQSVAEWQKMQTLLLASWPAEEPRLSFFLPNPRRQGHWLETARTWFGVASMGAVAGCLLLLAVLRPAVSYNHNQLSINFSKSYGEEGAISAQAVTQAQVQAWVQQALEQTTAAGASETQPTSGASPIPSNTEQARRVTQLGVQVEMLKENQSALWQQVEQHGVYLQSAWRGPSDQIESQRQKSSDRP